MSTCRLAGALCRSLRWKLLSPHHSGHRGQPTDLGRCLKPQRQAGDHAKNRGTDLGDRQLVRCPPVSGFGAHVGVEDKEALLACVAGASVDHVRWNQEHGFSKQHLPKVEVGEEVPEPGIVDYPVVSHTELYSQVVESLVFVEVSSALHLNGKAARVVAFDVNLEVSPLIVSEWNSHLQAASRPQHQHLGNLVLVHESV